MSDINHEGRPRPEEDPLKIAFLSGHVGASTTPAETTVQVATTAPVSVRFKVTDVPSPVPIGLEITTDRRGSKEVTYVNGHFPVSADGQEFELTNIAVSKDGDYALDILCAGAVLGTVHLTDKSVTATAGAATGPTPTGGAPAGGSPTGGSAGGSGPTAGPSGTPGGGASASSSSASTSSATPSSPAASPAAGGTQINAGPGSTVILGSPGATAASPSAATAAISRLPTWAMLLISVLLIAGAVFLMDRCVRNIGTDKANDQTEQAPASQTESQARKVEVHHYFDTPLRLELPLLPVPDPQPSPTPEPAPAPAPTTTAPEPTSDASSDVYERARALLPAAIDFSCSGGSGGT